MKKKKYTIEIENFPIFYDYLLNQHDGIIEGRYNEGELELVFDDDAKILTREQLEFSDKPIIIELHKKTTIKPELEKISKKFVLLHESTDKVRLIIPQSKKQAIIAKIKELRPELEEVVKNAR